MKKVLLISFALVALLATWYGEARKFYCLDNGECITVWKTYNNVCYIIPGKYYGVIKPSKNFIQTTNTNNLTIYFTTKLPKAFIYQGEQPLKINNNTKSEFTFYSYSSDSSTFDKLLYLPNATKNNDLKSNARLIDIFIEEDYAIDKNGKKL